MAFFVVFSILLGTLIGNAATWDPVGHFPNSADVSTQLPNVLGFKAMVLPLPNRKQLFSDPPPLGFEEVGANIQPRGGAQPVFPGAAEQIRVACRWLNLASCL